MFNKYKIKSYLSIITKLDVLFYQQECEIMEENTIEFPIPITKPALPDFNDMSSEISEILSSRMITNYKYVKEFETKSAEYLGVEHAIAVSSCTAGIMLLLKTMKFHGEIILPSFTFHATAHAIVWNGLKLRFVDIDPETQLIDPEKVREAINKDTCAICGVHTFGNPCNVETLQEIADDKNLFLYYDAAHAFGSKRNNKNIGCFGNAEIFSLSPTKLVVAGEGGLVTTNDKKIMQNMKLARNYGDPGNNNSQFSGFNARMSEINALLGIKTLKNIEENVISRNLLVLKYKNKIGNIPGITFQKILPNDRTTFKDFSIILDDSKFGMNRDTLQKRLSEERIITRPYFYPPTHKQDAYTQYASQDNNLTITDEVSKNVLSLPLWSQMPENIVDYVSKKIINIYEGL